MIKLIAAVFLTLLSFCAEAKTSIVFINGITTSPDRAILSTNILQYRYCVYAGKNCSDIEFKNFYNSTEGFFDDNGELDVQAQVEQLAISKANNMTALALKLSYIPDPKSYIKGSDAYNIFYAYLNTYMSELYLEKETKAEGIVYDKNFFNTDTNNANKDIQRNLNGIIIKIVKELEKEDFSRKVVLVPHSQGNYFAQAAYAIIKDKAPDVAKNLSVQGVASVSTIGLMNGKHTSLVQDRALFGHEISHDYNVNGNFQGGWKLGDRPESDDFLQENLYDPTNHGFIETYLGAQIVKLPNAFGECIDVAIPNEIIFEQRDASRIKYHITCQDKDSLSNTGLLIGVGSKFPSLRGVFLARHIVDKIANSIPVDCLSNQELVDGACVGVSFQNDFTSTANLNGWQFTLPWNSTYKTTDYSLRDGYLELRMDQTDKGGWALSSSFPSSDKIKVSVNHYMDGGTNFFPTIMLTNDGAAPENIVPDVAFKNIQVGFVRSYYGPDYACSAFDIPRVIDSLGCVAASKTSPTSSSSLFKKWINTVIVYDSISGELTVDYENDGVVDFIGTISAANRFKVTRLAFGTFGWYPGHLHRIDSFKVESIN